MNTICVIRNIYNALYQFESEFEYIYGLSINEAMLLCAVEQSDGTITSSALAERTGMAPSHTSKVIRTVEEKGLIARSLGASDKRQMYFSLTPQGKDFLKEINLEKVEVPELLKPFVKETLTF